MHEGRLVSIRKPNRDLGFGYRYEIMNIGFSSTHFFKSTTRNQSVSLVQVLNKRMKENEHIFLLKMSSNYRLTLN